LNKKAQFAIEHILVVAFGLLIIIPIVYFFYTYSIGQVEEVSHTQISKTGNDIINNAEAVYFMGKPSRITLDVNMPDMVHNITIMGNKEIVFFLNAIGGDYTEMAFIANVPISGVYLNSTSTRCDEVCWSPGLKHITVESLGDEVAVIIK